MLPPPWQENTVPTATDTTVLYHTAGLTTCTCSYVLGHVMYVHVRTSVNHTSTCSMHELYTGSICSIHTYTQYQLSTSRHVYTAVYANYVCRYVRKQTSSFFQKSFKGCVFLHVPIVHPLLTIKLQVELVLSHASEQRSPASALLTYSGH